MTERMRAITQRAYGGPEVLVLTELARPQPGPGEVLVRTHAIGVNPSDWKTRSGIVRRFGPPPFTIGLDFSGTVAGLGDGDSRFSVGDEVYGIVFPPGGSYAEYVVVSAEAVALKPARLDHVHAAALPVAALTAWQPLVKIADIGHGGRVLIHAAAGGVGHLAVQIAKARGAYVVGTARAANHAFLRRLGADELIDYTQSDFSLTVKDIDVVLDTISGDYGARSLKTLKPSGMLIDVRGSGPDRSAVRDLARERGLEFVEFYVRASGTDLTEIAELAERGQLTAAVNHVFPLSEAARAHELSETGRVSGKIVLTS